MMVLRIQWSLLLAGVAIAQSGFLTTPLFAQNGGDASETADLTFDDIKFDMDKEAEFDRAFLTDKINDLDGKRIRIRGYILPSFKQTNISKFILVRDNQECCFGPGAALCDCILVKLEKGQEIDFTVRPITVTGTFYLKEFKSGNKVLAVFRLKNGVVE